MSGGILVILIFALIAFCGCREHRSGAWRDTHPLVSGCALMIIIPILLFVGAWFVTFVYLCFFG